ncbi:hypothetical protein GCM10010275_56160 [Streptomyces litmocidini]|nr:hypothetical protein GCM10010275_56160 [Streptomyces litmocidini]
MRIPLDAPPFGIRGAHRTGPAPAARLTTVPAARAPSGPAAQPLIRGTRPEAGRTVRAASRPLDTARHRDVPSCSVTGVTSLMERGCPGP